MTLLSALQEAVEAQKRLRDLYALAADREKEKGALAFLIALSVEKQRSMIFFMDRLAEAQGREGLGKAVLCPALKPPLPAPECRPAVPSGETRGRLEFIRQALGEEKKACSFFAGAKEGLAGEGKAWMASLEEIASGHILILERIAGHLNFNGKFPDAAALEE